MHQSNTTIAKPLPNQEVLQQIRARVNPSLLKNTHLLFNQSRYTTFHELLQNCRRAQATQVDIQILPCGEKVSKVKITDNGVGIENPAKLLILGDSDWNYATKSKETPAGMGFFSLCHLSDGVEVQSKTWRMHITKESFLGTTDVDLVKSPELTGTSISFLYPENAEILKNTVKACAYYYPVPVKLNATACHQESFTAQCIYHHQVEGATIGIATTDTSKFYSECLNFHGLTLFQDCLLPSSIASRGFIARVDIHDNRILDLVLPARNQVVENSKWEELKAHCRRAVYLTIQNLKMKHTLCFKDFLEAQNMGIILPEATPSIETASQQSINSYLTFNPFPNEHREHEINPTIHNVAIKPETAAETLAYFMANYLQTKKGEPELPLLIQEDKTKEGYSWYPKTKVTSVRFKTDHQGKTITWDPSKELKNTNLGTSKEKRPENIQVEISFSKENQSKNISVESPIGFWATESYNEEHTHSWTLTKNIKNQGEIPFNLERLFLALYFSERYDPESESYEKQEKDFTEDIQEFLAHIFENNEEWAMQKLKKTIEDYKLLETLNLAGIQEFKVTLNNNEGTTIQILKKFE